MTGFVLLFACTFSSRASARFPLQKITIARADEPQSGDYACILEEDTFFYATPSESQGIFLLPTTYYVKLLDYDPTYCRVEYLYDDTLVQKRIGYVKTEQLTFVPYVPKRPYFYHVFPLSYRIDETAIDNSSFLGEITLSCAYYGDYKIGSKTYCYVLRGETYGYVPKPLDLTVPENTEYADYLAAQASSEEEESSVETPKAEKSSPAQIAILVALCLLVPVLAALILKPPKRPPYDTDGD